MKPIYLKPIELRIVKHSNGGYVYYTVNKVWEGIGNVTFGGHKFMTLTDVINWCKMEYPHVPRLFEIGCSM